MEENIKIINIKLVKEEYRSMFSYCMILSELRLNLLEEKSKIYNLLNKDKINSEELVQIQMYYFDLFEYYCSNTCSNTYYKAEFIDIEAFTNSMN
jgi:hypothetical protein